MDNVAYERKAGNEEVEKCYNLFVELFEKFGTRPNAFGLCVLGVTLNVAIVFKFKLWYFK